MPGDLPEATRYWFKLFITEDRKNTGPDRFGVMLSSSCGSITFAQNWWTKDQAEENAELIAIALGNMTRG